MPITSTGPPTRGSSQASQSGDSSSAAGVGTPSAEEICRTTRLNSPCPPASTGTVGEAGGTIRRKRQTGTAANASSARPTPSAA